MEEVGIIDSESSNGCPKYTSDVHQNLIAKLLSPLVLATSNVGFADIFLQEALFFLLGWF